MAEMMREVKGAARGAWEVGPGLEGLRDPREEGSAFTHRTVGRHLSRGRL